MYTSERRDLCIAQISLLYKTTAILGSSANARSLAEIKRRRIYDTLRIFRSGTDAAGLNRSDISALPKFAIKSVHGCTLLMMRRSRCTVYPRKKPFENSLFRSVHPCTLLNASFCEAKTSLLRGTTDIPVRDVPYRALP